MQERQLLRPEDARMLRLLETYGELIANTDRHYGNISLLLDGDDWALSPADDMLLKTLASPTTFAGLRGTIEGCWGRYKKSRSGNIACAQSGCGQ